MNFLNFLIVKFLVKTKYANIINIINNKEIIPELIQKKCNALEIYKLVTNFLNHPKLIENQIIEVKKTLLGIKSNKPSAENAANVIFNYL